VHQGLGVRPLHMATVLQPLPKAQRTNIFSTSAADSQSQGCVWFDRFGGYRVYGEHCGVAGSPGSTTRGLCLPPPGMLGTPHPAMLEMIFTLMRAVRDILGVSTGRTGGAKGVQLPCDHFATRSPPEASMGHRCGWYLFQDCRGGGGFFGRCTKSEAEPKPKCGGLVYVAIACCCCFELCRAAGNNFVGSLKV